MEITVLPFVPEVTDVNPEDAAALQLERIIDTKQSEGWEFVSLSSLQTSVKPTGCNAATYQKGQATSVNIQLLIFKK